MSPPRLTLAEALADLARRTSGGGIAVLRRVTEALALMPCGHFVACVSSTDEGTCYCTACEAQGQAVAAAVRAALGKYGQHLPDCSRGLPSAGRPCDCGLLDAMGPLSAREEEKRRAHPELGPFPRSTP